MKNRRLRQIILFVVLNLVTLVILLIPLQQGKFFGTNGDWYSQHIAIADSLRKAMLQNKCLVPQFINLGGGSSVYDFAYYGLLRPDVLIACLFPNVGMRYFIAVYAILGVIASVDLCYIWLRMKRMEKPFALAGALLLGTTTCFAQAHHQIMFVNYMPFLIIALIGVDHLIEKKHYGLLTIGLFFVYIHSFYYSISCLFVAAIYFFYKLGRQDWIQERIKKKAYKEVFVIVMQYIGRAAIAVILSIGMAMVLLLPMGLDILSTKKDGGSFTSDKIHLLNLQMNGLLYSSYGCGFTMLSLFALIRGIFEKEKRWLSAVLLAVMLCPWAAYILNGFLYARSKILIPFGVLIVFLMADMLQSIYHDNRKCFGIPLLVCLCFAAVNKSNIFAYVDVFLLAVWFILLRSPLQERIKKILFWFVLVTPVFCSIGLNMSGSYLREICDRLKIRTGVEYLDNSDERQQHFTEQEVDSVVTDSRYRFDILSNNFVNSNILASSNCGRTSMYSSVTNADYSSFYYDTMHNAIGANNRVALTPSGNPCFSYFMGVRYIATGKKQIPDGYESIYEKDNYVIAENENVLPVCYGTSNILKESMYQQLDFPENMIALCQNVVVKEKGNLSESRDVYADKKARQGIQYRSPAALFTPSSLHDFMTVGKKGNTTLRLNHSMKGYYLILSFDIDRKGGKEVKIDIDGVANKLSAKWAPYPNQNNKFVYILPVKDGTTKLKVRAQRGKYHIKKMGAYLIQKNAIKNDNVILPEEETHVMDGTTVYEGTITMEDRGYFVTSYPYRKGYQVLVDGKKAAVKKVNTTFVGVSLKEGKHRIQIRYVAPGYEIGLKISVCCAVLYGMLLLYEWVRWKKMGGRQAIS